MANTLEDLRQGYEDLFATMVVKADRVDDADAIASRINDHKSVYETIMEATGVPWQIVGIFHSLEGNLNFGTHLHNGDSLSRRTVRVPAGRPANGDPPFTFAESAIDALRFDRLANLTNWGLAETLFRLEKFNGFGYRRSSIDINTPYLWSFSNHYIKGKFKSDGVFSRNLVSQQCGAAILLRRMIDRNIFDFDGLPRALDVIVDSTARPKVSAFLHKGNSWIAPRLLSPFVRGLSVAAVSNNPLTITLQFRRGSGSNVVVKTRSLEGKMFHGNGHVDASDLVREFLSMELRFDDSTSPDRLLITTNQQ